MCIRDSYYVVHEDAWAQLKKDVGTYLNEHETIL